MTQDLHPRLRYALEGVEAQGQAFEHAQQRGRLHHAWMLTGPEGMGKASFAFRAARRLLGARPDPAFGPIGASADDPVCRLIASQSHPDLLVLERSGEGTRKVIPVDEARRLPEFFSKAPALGRYRVAIIDSVDDFNANGANAVLKTLEEPSGQGVLFLISHAPGRLLPTIRSRCRTLAFRPWDDEAVSATLLARGASNEDAPVIAAMAKGSPGRAAALMQTSALDVERMALALMSTSDLPRSVLAAQADSFRGGEGAAKFALLIDRLSNAAQKRARSADPRSAARWAELWGRLNSLPSRVDGLNLDRADAFWALVNDITATVRATC